MSGIGLNGGIARCFPLMQDLQRCLKNSDDVFKDCLVFKDEYMECLHHRVEVSKYCFNEYLVYFIYTYLYIYIFKSLRCCV